MEEQQHGPPVAVYADGGVIESNPSTFGGTWAFCQVDASGQRILERSGVIPFASVGWPITNNFSELTALIEALESLPDGWSGLVHSDSQVSLGRLFKGWALRGIPVELFQRATNAIARLGSLQPVRLDGHPTVEQLRAGVGKRGGPVSIHQVWCDTACNTEARRFMAGRAAVARRELFGE
jgi:ribonuclease HI